MKAVAVVVEGPFSEQDRWGDEFPTWAVAAVDDDGETVGKHYTVWSFDKAMDLGRRMANDRRLSFQSEASPA